MKPGRLATLRQATGPFIPLAVLLSLLGVIGVVNPPFLSLGNLGVLADESSVILLLATAQTLVILLGCIDLSMAALAGLASVLIALAVPTMGGLGVLGVLALSTLAGAFQGFVHARAQLPSVVVTLAGLGMWSGIALTIAHATIPVDAGYSAVAWLDGTYFGLPGSFAFAAGALVVLAAALRWLPLGRHVHAIGLSPKVAVLSGIRVDRVKVLAFAVAGLFAGLAGMTMVARTSSGNPTIADSLLLPCIAAVVMGGTAMTGGVGGLGRTLIGALTVTLLRAGITAAGVDPAFEPIAYGILLVLAVALTADRRRAAVTK
ncbi:MAG TPA: ABC transporter permease [Burkholderiaceae bacterium]|nr:ABC transporter permease [Burkholderiaceae bacterium]